MSDYDLKTWQAIAQRDMEIMKMEAMTLTCPDCGHTFTLSSAWDTDIACCVHHCNGKEIADVGRPRCGSRVETEIKETLQ